jgi:hypothetical protein
MIFDIRPEQVPIFVSAIYRLQFKTVVLAIPHMGIRVFDAVSALITLDLLSTKEQQSSTAR